MSQPVTETSYLNPNQQPAQEHWKCWRGWEGRMVKWITYSLTGAAAITGIIGSSLLFDAQQGDFKDVHAELGIGLIAASVFTGITAGCLNGLRSYALEKRIELLTGAAPDCCPGCGC